MGVRDASHTDSEDFRDFSRDRDSVAISAAELEAVRPFMLRSAGVILRRPEDVEDAVQEAFLRILRSNTRVDSARGSLAAFAGTTVRRVALDMLARRKPALGNAADLAAPMPEPDAERLDAAHTKDRLRAAVDALPDAQRTAFLLVHQEGLSHEDVARELRISQESLRARLFGARCQLRHSLKDLRP